MIIIAGPCAVESFRQASTISEFVRKYGATCFRGGCYKGQNAPVVNGQPEYKGLGNKAVRFLSMIQDMGGLPCVTDMQSVEQARVLLEWNIAHPMVGARNMDSLELLRQFRHIFFETGKKIVLKRGPSATIKEFIGAAEHLGGPEHVILCERGTVHFDRHDYTRYRIDMVGVAEVKHYYPEYQIIVDVSHGSGNRALVPLLAKAAIAMSDGIMVEVHQNPDASPTDAPQTIDCETFKKMSMLWEKT